MAILGLGTDLSLKSGVELAIGTIFYLGIVLLITSFKNFKPARFFQLDLTSTALILFACVTTIQAQTYIIDTEIPRLKLVYRFIYLAFAFFNTTALSRNFSKLSRFILALLLFTSFPYHWLYVLSFIQSIPLILLFAYYLLDMDDREKSELRLLLNPRDPWTAIPIIMILGFVVSNAANLNFFKGTEGALRLLVGIGAYFFIRINRKRFSLEQGMLFLIALSVLHALWFYASIIINTFSLESYNPLLTKKTALSGINANDISGYIITIMPLIMGFSLCAKNTHDKKAYIYPALLALNAALLILVKSRAAWPISIISFVLFFYWSYRKKSSNPGVLKLYGTFSVITAIASMFLLIILLTAHGKDLAHLFVLNTLKIRFLLWKLSYFALLEHPFIGIGYENYQYLASLPLDSSAVKEYSGLIRFYQNQNTHLHSHNTFLQIWLDGGIIYLGGFLALCGLALYRFLRNGKSVLIAAGVFSIASLLIQGSLNYHFMNYSTWLVFWILLGYLSAPPLQETSESSENKSVRFLARPWIGVAFFGLLSYHSMLLILQAEALHSLKQIRFLNSRNMLILKSRGPAFHKRELARARRASAFASAARKLNPGALELNQIEGEIRYFLYRKTGNTQDLKQANLRYKRCVQLDPRASLCHLRLRDIIRTREPEAVEKYNKHDVLSKKTDPFSLNRHGVIRSF